MTRAAAASGALVAAVLLLGAAGCTSSAEREDGGAVASSGGAEPAAEAPSDAALVAEAGLEPCPASAGGGAEGGGAEAGGAAGGGGERLPDTALPCLGAGPAVSLAGLAGAPTVVNLWASWCGPCVEELPALQAAHGEGGLRVVGVLTHDRPRQGLAAAAGLGVQFPSVVDESGVVLRSLGLKALPATVLLRPDGTVAHTHVGPALDTAAVRALAAEHLGVPADGLAAGAAS